MEFKKDDSGRVPKSSFGCCLVGFYFVSTLWGTDHVGIVFIIWIILILIYFPFLIIGFKRKNKKLLNALAVSTMATAVTTVVITLGYRAATAITDIAINTATVSVIMFGIAPTIVIASFYPAGYVAAAVAADNEKKMFISSFLCYCILLPIFYYLSDMQHTIILMVSVPAVFILTWRRVEYKNQPQS